MKVHQWTQMVRIRVRQAASQWRPGAEALRGAEWGLRFVLFVLLAILAFDLQTGLGRIVDVVLVWILGVLALGAATEIMRLLFRVARRLSPDATAVALLAFAGFLYFFGISPEVAWPLALAVWIVAALLGASVGLLWQGNRRPQVWGAAVLGLLLAGTGVGWLLFPGFVDDSLTIDVAQQALAPSAPNGHPNPGEPGPFAVDFFTYGSGADRHRHEYADGVRFRTQPVDGSAFVTFDGWAGQHRTWFWGFDETALPLNGRVWLPMGDGPFPLALIVHGNHDMTDFSDAGYAYLGEHLASHGMILVSVDQNFLNGNMAGTPDEENDARAWLLLEHLAQWRQWTQAPDHPLRGKVDLARVALIGHSRGGEAAAIAAAFNRLERHPDDATVEFDFEFGIRSVIALAPSDQQYQPADRPLPLAGISYLVLQGSNDADVSEYNGFRQYQRVALTQPDQFKAGIYIHRANHGQFNTDWGRTDFGIPRRFLLNTANLLPGDEQRQIAKTLITAFLKATLLDEAEYRTIFQDHRRALAWLPDTDYQSQYQDATFRAISNYEEDVDVTTATVAGGTIQAHGFEHWHEAEVRFRDGRSQQNSGVWLDWEGRGAVYEIELPAGTTEGKAAQVLSFNLSNGLEDKTLDFHVELEDTDGERSAILMSEFWTVLPPLPARFTKWDPWEDDRYGRATDRVFQTYRLPLSRFVEENPALDVSALRSIHFHFDRTADGAIYLDEIGFAR